MKRLICYCLLLLSVACQGQSNTTLPDDVVQSIKKRIENGVNPSIIVGIIDGDGPHYFNYGLKKAKGALADEHTIYEIGSISKVFTAILLAQQSIDGKLRIDDPIKKYLPANVKVPVRGATEISFGNLSDHTSSLPRMPSNMNPANPANPFADYTVGQMYSYLSGYELPRDVGSAYEYSNFAQGLLGHILSLNAGTTYEALLIKTIASPLGMNETKITFDQTMKNNLAIGHSGGAEVENWDIPTLAGAGAIRSSAYDMLKFLKANMGLTKTTLLAAMNKTHEVRHNKAGDMRVGLGWHIAKGKNGDVIWHNGGTGGYRTFSGFVKETGMGVVILTNSTESIDDIGFHLLNPESKLVPVAAAEPTVAVAVPEAILETYLGTYELAPGFNIVITRQGTQLFAQATGQGMFELFAKNDKEFYLKVVKAQISFDDVDKSLTLFQNGQVIKGKRTN